MSHIDLDRLHLIAERLDKMSAVTKYDEGEKEAWRIVYGLRDICESADKIQKKLSGDMMLSGEESAIDTLNEIGDELRHIMYHCYDMKYFTYIQQHRLD